MPFSAADFTWTNLTANGSLGLSNGYTLATASNWNTSPTFSNTSVLNFLNGTGSTTIYAGAATTTVNKLVFSGGNLWRINSGSSTLNFAGTAPEIGVQSGTARLEFILQSSVGVTKTGSGTVFSNLQSVSSGFTGPLTIAAGTWQAGNNFALGDQKTVNILSGGTLNMSSTALGSSGVASSPSIGRNYTFNIAGTGDGSGAIVNNGNVLNGYSGIHDLTLTGNASIGGTGTYDIGYNGGVINGGGNTLTKLGTGTIWMRGAASNIAYQVDEGTLVANSSASSLGGAGGSVAVASGATLASSGAISLATPLNLSSGSVLSNLGSGAAIWSGNIALGSGNGVTVTGANSSANISISGAISGAGGSLIKAGGNTLTLTNSNTYSGVSSVTQGTLAVGASGSISESSEIRISTGASLDVTAVSGFTVGENQILSGGGTVLGAAVITGTHSPGFSPGIQTFNNSLTYTTGSTLVWELADNTFAAADRGVDYDGINVAGSLTFSGATLLQTTFDLAGSTVDWSNPLWSGFVNGSGGWKIFSGSGTVTGLENLTLPAMSSLSDSNGVSLTAAHPSAFFHLYQGSDGVYLNYAVPEPSTALLGGLGMLALLRRRRTPFSLPPVRPPAPSKVFIQKANS